MPPTQHMEMEMEDSLSGIATGIRHQPIARLPQPFQRGDLRTTQEQLRQQRLIPHPYILNGRNVPLGYHQRMDGRLGVDIIKRHRMLILLNQLHWNLL